jgi:hypothetical protein
VHSLAVSKTDKHVAIGCSTSIGLFSIKGKDLEWLEAPVIGEDKAEAQALAFSAMGGVFAIVTLYDSRVARISVYDILGNTKFYSSLTVPEVSPKHGVKVSESIIAIVKLVLVVVADFR